MKTSIDSNRYATPPELGRLWRVKPSRIIAMIRRGDLRAFSVAEPGSRRPRYRIPPDSIIEYENRHNGATVPTPSRRRRADPAVIQFF